MLNKKIFIKYIELFLFSQFIVLPMGQLTKLWTNTIHKFVQNSQKTLNGPYIVYSPFNTPAAAEDASDMYFAVTGISYKAPSALFYWTSYVPSPWRLTSLCLWFGGVVAYQSWSIPFYQFQIPFQFLFINSWVNSNSFGFEKSQFQFLEKSIPYQFHPRMRLLIHIEQLYNNLI